MVLAATLASAPYVANAQTLVTERNISFNAANEAATAALAQCRKDGYHVTVTVLDRSARTKVVLHDDGASPHTIEHSLRKAYTSLTYRSPSGEYGKRATSNPTGVGALHLDKIATAEGALPIFAGKEGKELVGSIGVSGSPGGDKDTVCSQAGIDRIAKGLAGG